MGNLSNIGIAGLAVMGENLVLNMVSKGLSVSVFNRTFAKTDKFINGRGKSPAIQGFQELKDFVNSLQPPRKIMMMLKAGKIVDDFIDQLIPLLDKGDIIIDGGNSFYKDTEYRVARVEEKGLLFIGTGVSGGEEGALNGPSIMPGGSKKAWPHLENIFQSISAQIDDGSNCCTWMGKGGAGHFVKMVHNGIEYGDMQLICESYQIMKNMLNMSADEIHDTFKEWNTGDLDSYLIEITRDIMSYRADDGSPLVEKILDTAGQKGTGKWTVNASLDLGTPLSLISESVFARCLSAEKDERVKASKILNGPEGSFSGDKQELLDNLQKALFMAKIISYSQGFSLMRAASKEHDWDLNFSEIARIWRGGCIIRSVFLDRITDAYHQDPSLSSLTLSPYFSKKLDQSHMGLRSVIANSAMHGISIPCHASALSYYDGFRSSQLPANLLQAQRDYFGAHTYERVDKPSGNYFHTNWTGKGGDTTSTTYDI